MRTVFLGTAELARHSLQALVRSPQVELLGVVSQPDKAKGRQLRQVPSAVKVEALKHSLPVWQPSLLRKDTRLIEHLNCLDIDVIVVAAYGQILPASVLEIPKFGCVNVHTSLLPRYRGAAPIQWAILNGDRETGVTIMKMDEGLDTGDILTQMKTPIHPIETGGELHDRLAELGANLLVDTLPKYLRGNLSPDPQDPEKATYARKLSKSDGQVNWTRSAIELANQIRGLNPWPGTFSHLSRGSDSRLIKFWRAEPLSGDDAEPGTVISASPTGVIVACSKGHLRLTSLQREGGKRLEAGPFLAGFPIKLGNRFANSHDRTTVIASQPRPQDDQHSDFPAN